MYVLHPAVVLNKVQGRTDAGAVFQVVVPVAFDAEDVPGGGGG